MGASHVTAQKATAANREKVHFKIDPATLMWALVFGLGMLVVMQAHAQQAATATAVANPTAAPAKKITTPGPAKKTTPGPAIELEPKALAIVKAALDKLAGAKTMAFTAIVTEESPSRLGPALVYRSRYDVVLQRPDKLRVVSPSDGPPSEFYTDGTSMIAFAPVENMIAIGPAPANIDDALDAAYAKASIYYPFIDLIVSDPYKDFSEGLRVAFYIGQSKTVDGTTTDIVAWANDHAFVQAWIGAEDKLPRKLRAVYRKDAKQLRHEMDLSNWQLDAPVAADTFGPPPAAKTAQPIAFASPESTPTKGAAKAATTK